MKQILIALLAIIALTGCEKETIKLECLQGAVHVSVYRAIIWDFDTDRDIKETRYQIRDRTLYTTNKGKVIRCVNY